MMWSDEVTVNSDEKRYKGIRRRKWGKWVSEIRVPGTSQRLWLGSYASPEAAAVAHDTAVLLLRGPSSSDSLNFPDRASTIALPAGNVSPLSVQRLASESGMAVDAELIAQFSEDKQLRPQEERDAGEPENLVLGDISVDDYM